MCVVVVLGLSLPRWRVAGWFGWFRALICGTLSLVTLFSLLHETQLASMEEEERERNGERKDEEESGQGFDNRYKLKKTNSVKAAKTERMLNINGAAWNG